MNAYIQIIARLIESVPPSVWRSQRFFPFLHINYPVASLFDACLFSQSSSGVLGLLWVRFEGEATLLSMPFRLARYSESGDLISLSPWSLRDASCESEFYDCMRSAMHKKNPIVSSLGGVFRYRYAHGEPSAIALGLRADELSTSIRVESQETFKIYKTISLRSPKPVEVTLLEFLSSQNKFVSFPKLISVYEYKASPSDDGWSCIAFSTQYIQHQGTLWHAFLNDLQACRYAHPLKMKSAKVHRAKLLEYCESIGRMLAEFHAVLLDAREFPQLMPESTRGKLRERWLLGLRHRVSESISVLSAYWEQNAFPSAVMSALMDKLATGLETIELMEDPGLLVCIHGKVHLGQFLMGSNGPYLVDFGSHSVHLHEYFQQKQEDSLSVRSRSLCLEDLAAVLLSMRYSWHQTTQSDAVSAGIDWETLENETAKCYLNLVREDPKSAELLPPHAHEVHCLREFYFLLRLVDELVADVQLASPRLRLSLEILHESLSCDVQ